MDTTEPTAELERNLYENEEIEWVVQPSATARFVSTGLGSLIGGFVGGGILGFVVFLAITILFPPLVVFAVPAGIAVFVFVLVWTMRAHVARWLLGTTEYAATNHRLITFGGVFGRRFSSIPLEGIQDTQYDISTTEKFFDVGTVTVDTKKGYESMRFPYTPAPADFAREVNSLASRTRQGAAPAVGRDETYAPGEGVTSEEPADDLSENIYPDEELLWVITQDKTSRLLTDSPGVVLSALLTGAVFGLTRSVSAGTPVGLGVGTVVAAVKFLLSAASYYRGATQYAATDRRIIEYEGRLGKRFDSVPLEGIQDAEYGVSFAEHFLDVGTVTLDTDRGYEGMALSNVPDPPDVAREISRLAGSGIAQRSAVHPSEVSVGDGVDTEEASSEMRKNVHADESIAWVVTPDTGARLMKNIVQGIPGAAVGGILLGGIAGVFAAGVLGPTLAVVVGALAFVGVILLSLYATFKQYVFDRTEYAMTDDRLIDYSGAFGRELSGVPLEGIQDAEYSTTFVEQRFGVGDVTVDVHRGYDPVSLNAVANPAAVAREISEIANAYRVTGAEREAEGAQATASTSAESNAAAREDAATAARRTPFPGPRAPDLRRLRPRQPERQAVHPPDRLGADGICDPVGRCRQRVAEFRREFRCGLAGDIRVCRDVGSRPGNRVQQRPLALERPPVAREHPAEQRGGIEGQRRVAARQFGGRVLDREEVPDGRVRRQRVVVVHHEARARRRDTGQFRCDFRQEGRRNHVEQAVGRDELDRTIREGGHAQVTLEDGNAVGRALRRALGRRQVADAPARRPCVLRVVRDGVDAARARFEQAGGRIPGPRARFETDGALDGPVFERRPDGLGGVHADLWRCAALPVAAASVVELLGDGAVIVSRVLDQRALGGLVHPVEPARGVRDHRDELRVARVDDARHALRGGEVEPLADLPRPVDGFVPVRVGPVRLREVVRRRPRPASEGLDDERPDVLLGCPLHDGLVIVFGVVFRHDDRVQREHHGFEVVDAVDGVDDEVGVAVTRQAEVFDQPLVAGLAEGFERAALGRDRVEFLAGFEAVDLVEVDGVDPQAVQGPLQFVAGAVVLALAGLAAEEYPLAVLAELRAEFEFRVAVGRRDVEVVDAGVEDVLDHLVGALLFEPVQRDSAECHHRALVAGVAERSGLHTGLIGRRE